MDQYPAMFNVANKTTGKDYAINYLLQKGGGFDSSIGLMLSIRLNDVQIM